MAERQPCFQHAVTQAVHKYADMVLLLLITAIAWWLVGLDGRVARTTERMQAIAAEATGARERSEAMLKRLDQIDAKLGVIDNRLYQWIGRQREGAPWP